MEVGGKQPAKVSRNLEAGAYLIEARERDIDLRLIVDAGGVHSELADDVPRHGLHAEVVSLSSAGALRIEARSDDHRANNGRVALRIARFKRAADAPPGQLELGYVAFGDAGKQIAIATPAARALAADELHEAIAHFDSAGDRAAGAQGNYALGNLQYLTRSEYAAAARAADMARDAYAHVDDVTGMHNAVTLGAATELELAAAKNATTQHDEQQALFEKADRKLAEAARFYSSGQQAVSAEYAVNMRGIGALYRGNDVLAGKFFAQAVDMARADHDAGGQAIALSNLAWVHNRRGNVVQAAREYETLLPLVERDRQPALYAAMLTNLGFCLVTLGDFDRALTLHTEALALFRELGEVPEQARQLSALGGIYLRLGDAEHALETLDSAIKVQRRVSDRDGEEVSSRLAANAAAILDRHDAALTYLHRAAQIAVRPNAAAHTHVLIAAELRYLGNLRDAESEIAQALQSPYVRVHASALSERAQISIAQRKYSAAIDDLRAADAQYATLGLEYDRIDTHTALSQTLLTMGDIHGATAAADEAIEIVRRIRVKSGNPEWRARFLAARYAPFEVRIAAELAGGAGGAVWRSFLIAEEVRARSLADTLASTASREVNRDEEALRAQLTALQLRLEGWVQRDDPEAAGMLELRRAIEETRAQLDSSRLRHGGIPAKQGSLPESLEEVQRKLPPDTAVLAYFVGDHTSHGWLLTSTGLRHEQLPARAQLLREVASLVASLRNGAAKRDAHAIGSRAVLGSLLSGLHAQRLLILPDGPLHGLPFAALAFPGGKPGEQLVDRFVIASAPSLTLALAPPLRPATDSSLVAIVSDPVYSPNDRRLTRSHDIADTLRGGDGARILARLPYSAVEARAVASAFAGWQTIQLEGFDATVARVLALPEGRLSLLHFATHAVVRRDEPEQSALFLSEYAADGSQQPSDRLTADDIARSTLRADLVVLSGCATGDGRELRGEGVLGLTYGFLANGSKSVVASLWPVEDAMTARFMEEFYTAYRVTGRASDSLRVAQLRTRGGASASVWSSFVVRSNALP